MREPMRMHAVQSPIIPVVAELIRKHPGTIALRPGVGSYGPPPAALTPKTRAVVTISPNNPTGAVYPEAALREVNAICREHGLYHIHDEAYEYFVYDGAKHFSPGSIPGAATHTISLYSLSKAYGFASWRIGAMVIP